MNDVLSAAQVERFVEDGFVHLPGVVDPATVAAGQDVIWRDLGCDPEDSSTWTAPVMRLVPSDPAPFLAAFDRARLHRAFDQLVGPGRWLARPHLGLFVVRFSHAADPGDTGWHIDSSFPPPDLTAAEEAALDFSRFRVNVFSRDRALLMLFLYSDVGTGDGPTRVRVGSHLDVAPILREVGDDGMAGTAASQLGAEASAARPWSRPPASPATSTSATPS